MAIFKTGNRERGTGNGERGTGNGERGTGNDIFVKVIFISTFIFTFYETFPFNLFAQTIYFGL